VDLPVDVTATITAMWANQERTWPIVVKGDQTEQLTMPAMGKVTVDFSGVDPPPFVIVLTPVGEHERPISALNPGAPGSRELTISPVPPGVYSAIFVADGKPGFGDARPEQVTVRAGETIRVVLRKP
jgi:hypothetical protein